MSEGLEFKARSVSKALARASQELGVAPEKLQYDILSHGATGIFGLTGIRQAHIRVISPRLNVAAEESQPPAGNGNMPSLGASRDEASLAPESCIAQGKELIHRIVHAISPEAQVMVEAEGRRIRYSIHSGEAGLLIGKHGQTLEAIQTLVEKSMRCANDAALKVVVDIEGYHQKKRAGLIRNAQRIAQKVKAKGQPASVGVMNAQDRRVIHLALKQDPGVRTQSKGEGHFRKLIIYPSRHTPKNKP